MIFKQQSFLFVLRILIVDLGLLTFGATKTTDFNFIASVFEMVSFGRGVKILDYH